MVAELGVSGAWLFYRSFSRLSRPQRSLVRTYIEDIKTDTIHLVVSDLAVVGRVLDWLDVRSVTQVQSLNVHTTIACSYLY